MVGMAGSLDVPFGHLAFDDAGLRAGFAGWVESVKEPGDGLFPDDFEGASSLAWCVVRGKNRPAFRPGTGG